MTTSYHVPVMLNASLEALNLGGDVEAQDGNWMDATFGGGGHSQAILHRLSSSGRLFGFDQDPDAANNALSDGRFTLVAANFRYAPQFLRAHGGLPLSGLLADLGVTHQFDTAERGIFIAARRPLGHAHESCNWRAGKRMDCLGRRANHDAGVPAIWRIQPPGQIGHRIAAVRSDTPIKTTHDLIRALSSSAPRGKENSTHASFKPFASTSTTNWAPWKTC